MFVNSDLTANFIQHAPVGICIMDAESFVVESLNDAFTEIAGKSREAILGKGYWEPFAEVREYYEEELKKVARTGITFKIEEAGMVLIRHGIPQEIFVSFTYAPVLDKNGKVEKIIVWVTEHTSKVRESEDNELLQLAIKAADMGIWSVDLESDKLTLSQRMRELHGLSSEVELTLTEAMGLIVEEFREEVAEGIRQARTKGTTFHSEYMIMPRDGSPNRWLMATASLRFNVHNQRYTLLGTVIDITERKTNEIRKNDFIGMLSHELKTPLTSINAYLQLLQHQQEDAHSQAVSILMNAQKQVKKMTNMINGFMSISRLENAKINIDKTHCDLIDLLQHVTSEFAQLNTGRAIVFQTPEQGIELWADFIRIEQVVGNLIGNAIKYSKSGTPVHVSCHLEGDLVTISVKDEGFGIAPEHLNKTFERYYRIEDNYSKTASGFGIGLFFCAEIIELHGGRIWAESKPGLGSTFKFTLPLKRGKNP